MPFYDVGPGTSRSNLTDFYEWDFWTGVTVFNPVNGWLNISGGAEFLKPEVGGVHDAGVRSIDQLYTEAAAPGPVSQPVFGHYRAALLPKYP